VQALHERSVRPFFEGLAVAPLAVVQRLMGAA
jgi:hypothetical protein